MGKELIKKIIILFLLYFATSPCFASAVIESPTVLEAPNLLQTSVTFDWFSKTQLERDENIKQVKTLLFNTKFTEKYPSKEFKTKYASYWKDKDYLKHYEEISNGKQEDTDKYYCGFYFGKLLIAYGLQYKNNLKNIFYYDAMGNLRWIDIFSPEYPNYPYYSYQYYRNGDFVASYYYVSKYDQYVFDYNKNFQGRWFKSKLYNRKNKVVMTRTNW